jgi:hypothetical protein
MLPSTAPTVTDAFSASKTYWRKFWKSGGALDLSHCKDRRAFELERRIVLFRYLTAIQCMGSFPPADTGLTINSWYGKFHLEMHWWYHLHYALWGHPEVLERTLPWYQSILSKAKQTAEKQGYAGGRWPIRKRVSKSHFQQQDSAVKYPCNQIEGIQVDILTLIRNCRITASKQRVAGSSPAGRIFKPNLSVEKLTNNNHINMGSCASRNTADGSCGFQHGMLLILTDLDPYLFKYIYSI